MAGRSKAMDYGKPRYFDYLEAYGELIEERIGYRSLVRDVERMRADALDDPDRAGAGCRKILEYVVRSLVGEQEVAHASLLLQIKWLKDSKTMPASVTRKMNRIRDIGNKATHEFIEGARAREVLVLLDEVLRHYVRETGIDERVVPSAAVQDEGLFLIEGRESAARSRKRARTAALLAKDDSVGRRVEDAQRDAATAEQELNQALAQIDALWRQLEVAGSSKALDGAKAGAAKQEGAAKLDALYAHARSQARKARQRSAKAQQDVERILSEYDSVRSLLGEDGRATAEQLEVMAFPRTAEATSRIMTIKGGAGTGKTLCLLARLIRDVEAAPRPGHGAALRKALFVCFNKPLVGYVEQILANHPSAADRIEIVNFDGFVNQLVRTTPSAKHAHLGAYAQDVRFEPTEKGAWNIVYESASDHGVRYTSLRRAVEEVARRHPEQARRYYLDATSEANLDWLNEEIKWLELRYDDVAEATRRYPTAKRVGRGRTHLPNQRIRKVILEIWEGYQAVLAERGLYTIEQAIKRLAESTELPVYDSIAVDEAQDFALRSIQLLFRMRRSGESYFYISGDEGQKIGQRDFNWGELEKGLRPHSVVLRENMRNARSVDAFARRLQGHESTHEEASGRVAVERMDDEAVLALVKRLAKRADETTALIGFDQSWLARLGEAGVEAGDLSHGGIADLAAGGVLYVGALNNKGLEFDNVIVDCSTAVSGDPEEERRIRYVHFTRARNELYVRYADEPSELMREAYADFL